MFLHRHFIARDEKPGNVIEDILRNLKWIFQSKRGCGYFMEQFGLSDTGFRTPVEMVEILSDELKENIKLFEPRIELLEIIDDYSPDTGRVCLELICRFAEEKEVLTLRLDPRTRQIEVVPLEELEDR